MDLDAQVPALEIPGIERLEALGRGGFGTVYRGWQPTLRREVAVKVLDAPVIDEASERRFEREAMAMGSLSGHPNVVPVYAAGAVAGRPYLVMPLLEGGSLEDRLAGGPLPPDEVVRLGQGLADALAAAHAAGVLHRDVKPANVLLTSHGSPQLADFGIARVADVTQTMGAPLFATVAYAAPEVLGGDPATERSDVYALGATLHAAARGRPPYETGPDDSPMSLAVRVMSADPPPLAAAGVPAALAAVIERAMARSPADRFASAAELRSALDGIPTPLATPTAVAETALAPAETGRPVDASERRRPLAPLLLLGLLLLAGLAALWWAQRDGGEGSTAAEPTTTTAPTSSSPSTTAEETAATDAPPTTTAAPSTSAPVVAAASGLGADAAEATRTYYSLMDAGRIDDGWASLSPAYQARTGEESYRSFWSGIESVDVLEVDGEDLTSRARLRYTRTDGSTSTEAVTLRFVRQGDGGLLIDDYQVG